MRFYMMPRCKLSQLPCVWSALAYNFVKFIRSNKCSFLLTNMGTVYSLSVVCCRCNYYITQKKFRTTIPQPSPGNHDVVFCYATL